MKRQRIPMILLVAAFVALLLQVGSSPLSGAQRRPGRISAQEDPLTDPALESIRKKQEAALTKDDYKRNLEDVAEIVSLGQKLEEGLKKSGEFVVDVNALKTLDRIEKLTRDVRGRMRRR